MRSALTESLRTEAARRPRVGTRNLSLTTTTLEPSAYPPVYVDRMRRWETKFNLLPHDRVILEVRATPVPVVWLPLRSNV